MQAPHLATTASGRCPVAAALYLLCGALLVCIIAAGDKECGDWEGTWSIGIFHGTNPRSLQPLERPTLDCTHTRAKYRSTFLADPFLWAHGGQLYVFYELKSEKLKRGVLGVSVSDDWGGSWQYLGVTLQEPWHLSYPFVLKHDGQMYMLPEGIGSKRTYLYKATNFPLEWERTKLLDVPLIDPVILHHEGMWYIIATPGWFHSCNTLLVYYSKDLMGPYTLHPKAKGSSWTALRNAGRPLMRIDGQMLRFGMRCDKMYGQEVRTFLVTAMNTTHFEEQELPDFHLPIKDSGKFVSVRHHHVNFHQIPNGTWIAAIDGDSRKG